MSGRHRVRPAAILRHGDGATRTDQILLAVEAPLLVNVRQRGRDVTQTLGLLMRTPGDDADLVVGLLHAEGVIRRAGDVCEIVEIRGTPPAHGDGAETETDAIEVTCEAGADLTSLTERQQLITGACGLCGRLAMQAIEGRPSGRAAEIDAGAIAALPDRLRSHQAVFAETGALHAAALVSAGDDDGTALVREDVGRHNAVDKVIGAALRADRPTQPGDVLVVSGRLAYEIVQKAALAGIQMVVAVGAPSSLAVEAGRAAGLTLVGFARGGRFNVYTGAERIRPGGASRESR